MRALRDFIFSYIDASRVAATKPDLLALTMRAVSAFEVEGLVVADVPGPDESFDPEILMSGWSPDWVSRYAERHYVRFDPIARAVQHNSAAYLWSEVCDRRLEREERMFMGEAAEYGLASGVSVPIHANGTHTCVSFTGRGLSIDEERRSALHYIGYYAYRRLRDLRQSDCKRLSVQETECLVWRSRGETIWETARILRISPDKVREHMISAGRKLNAANNAHTVAEAIRRKEIA